MARRRTAKKTKRGGTCTKNDGNMLQGSNYGGKKKSRSKRSKRGGQQQQQQQNDYDETSMGKQQQQQQETNTIKGGKECNGYCVKCKQKRGMEDCKDKKTKNGRNMISGVCEKCGTKMAKFVK
jgi:hypothetical protein